MGFPNGTKISVEAFENAGPFFLGLAVLATFVHMFCEFHPHDGSAFLENENLTDAEVRRQEQMMHELTEREREVILAKLNAVRKAAEEQAKKNRKKYDPRKLRELIDLKQQ